MDLQKRLIIALALSFLVFVGSSYFLGTAQPPQNGNELNTTTTKQAANNTAPTTAINQNQPKPTTTNTQNTPHTSPLQTTGNIIARVTSTNFLIEIDELGRIAQMTLREKKYRDEDGNDLQLIDTTQVKPLEIRFADTKINSESFAGTYSSSASSIDVSTAPATLTLTQNLSGVTITKEITFYADGHYDLNVKTTNDVGYFITTGHRPTGDKSNYYLVRGALVKANDGIISTFEDGEVEGDEVFNGAFIASAFDRYYASFFYDTKNGLNVTIAKDKGDDPLIFVQGGSQMTLHGYIGPKDYQVVKSIDPMLTEVIEYGWFTFLSKPFFAVISAIYAYVGNWGWAIIIFTILVKLILFPLSYKGMMSMQKLKDLAPKMKEIKEKYGKDPAKMNMKMMELYKKHGANPMGGCLPLLLQIPVFFALYRVLLNADEMQGAQWILWINDLAMMDPYFVLPILMGASMYFQQKITPTTITDPLQEKIFKWFPAIMTVFFVTFPSGLVLYWLTNNILSIAQQYYINGAYEKHKALSKEHAHNKEKES